MSHLQDLDLIKILFENFFLFIPERQMFCVTLYSIESITEFFFEVCML